MRSAKTFEEIEDRLRNKLSRSSIANQLNVLVKWGEVVSVEVYVWGSKVKFYGLVGRCNKTNKKSKKKKKFS